MWSTHPSGFEREENAKRTYIYAPSDERSSWILFKDPEALKRRMTKHLFKDVDVKDKQLMEISNEDALSEIDQEYNKVFFDAKYRGFYLKQLLTRSVKSVDELYTTTFSADEISEKIKNLYPESLKQDLAMYENKNEELLMLQALYDKQWDAPGGVILHEGRELKRKDLPSVIAQLKEVVTGHQNKFLEFNKGLRSLHVRIAEDFGRVWVDYLKGLSTLIHYSEHSIAIINDSRRVFNNTLHIVLVDGRVSSSEMSRLLRAAGNVTDALKTVYSNTSNVDPGPAVLERMKAKDWASLLEEFKLGYATAENINNWIQVVDGWADLAINRLERLRDAALEELILTEEKLVESRVNASSPGSPPAAAKISCEYPTLLSGAESILQSKLSLRDRFFSGDGILPSIARFGVAASVIGLALFAGHSINKADVIVYNGLSIPVTVNVAGESVRVDPLAYEKIAITEDENYTIEARTEDGSLIEKFNHAPDSRSGTYIYNVASSAAMQEWTVFYGTASYSSHYEPKQHIYGATRWFKSHADYFFTDPPETIEMRGSFEERSVLIASANPSAALSFLKDKS
ncbi:MAG TPA: hypothetical protein VGK46_02915, partial [Saprospiraceae bacterium]